jgi:signal transduction histidine kinase
MRITIILVAPARAENIGAAARAMKTMGFSELRIVDSQEHVALKVLDTGSGIPDYALSRIFERFYSLPRANGQKSSGLGLAFVSEVARLFNGEVTLRNVQEGGVLASLRLHRHFT